MKKKYKKSVFVRGASHRIKTQLYDRISVRWPALMAPKSLAMASPLHTLKSQTTTTTTLCSNNYQHYSQISFLTNEIEHKENS